MTDFLPNFCLAWYRVRLSSYLKKPWTQVDTNKVTQIRRSSTSAGNLSAEILDSPSTHTTLPNSFSKGLLSQNSAWQVCADRSKSLRRIPKNAKGKRESKICIPDISFLKAGFQPISVKLLWPKFGSLSGSYDVKSCLPNCRQRSKNILEKLPKYLRELYND